MQSICAGGGLGHVIVVIGSRGGHGESPLGCVGGDGDHGGKLAVGDGGERAARAEHGHAGLGSRRLYLMKLSAKTQEPGRTPG